MTEAVDEQPGNSVRLRTNSSKGCFLNQLPLLWHLHLLLLGLLQLKLPLLRLTNLNRCQDENMSRVAADIVMSTSVVGGMADSPLGFLHKTDHFSLLLFICAAEILPYGIELGKAIYRSCLATMAQMTTQ
ncbi:hypothetical protein MLD38_000382 [Melastoma candidum]|uniref:Uncharacterized protein n=1 Tax=Melastoma candidum TaxID=119954 RepID=A0ACB9S9H1_9MYRT|nr:hypothetical protein MLD38_000382 [Melastoma candidum]